MAPAPPRLTDSRGRHDRFPNSAPLLGIPAIKEHFYAILDIREGKTQRPRRYDDVYWDFVITGDAPPPGAEAGERLPLRSLMDRAGFSTEELQLLAEALRRSDRLVELEETTMNALEGRFRDREGRLSVARKPDRERALQLLFGEEYHQAKSSIMRPIDDVLQRVHHRTSTALAAAQDEQARREERLRALAADLTLTEEKERRRVATELHNGAVQALASARIRLNVATQRAETSEQAETLGEVSQLLRQSALEVNRIASGLSSPALNELGLVAAISEWMKDPASQVSGIETELVDQLDETDHEHGFSLR